MPVFPGQHRNIRLRKDLQLVRILDSVPYQAPDSPEEGDAGFSAVNHHPTVQSHSFGDVNPMESRSKPGEKSRGVVQPDAVRVVVPSSKLGVNPLFFRELFIFWRIFRGGRVFLLGLEWFWQLAASLIPV